MKYRSRENLRQFTALSMILGCLLYTFFLIPNEIPEFPDKPQSAKCADYISETETTLHMEDAREWSPSQSHSLYCKQRSVKRQTAGYSRMAILSCVWLPRMIQVADSVDLLSAGTVFHSHQILMNYIHNQDGEK